MDEFIERLAWRATDGKFDEDSFDPDKLYEAFENEIKDLKELYNTNQKRCEHLEMVCREEEKAHWIKLTSLQQKCKGALTTFEKLDKTMDVVADKVVYLGEQLEGVNTPRTRAVEAQKLMKHFAHYLKAQPSANPFENDIFLEDINKLYEEADIIQKLYLISQELPSGAKFERAKRLIDQRYNTIEEQLIEEFVVAQKNDDKAKMKRIASILSSFKCYSHCIDVFIEQSQMGIFLGENLFNDIVNLCTRNQRIIKEVFNNPDQVLAKFVLNIFHGKIQEYIQAKLDGGNKDNYLVELYTLFSKTNKLVEQLSKQKFLGLDHNFLDKITRNIFAKYLDQYINMETTFLKQKCAHILQSYYESKNHQKRPIATGTFQELIHSKITRTNLNISNLTNMNINSGGSNTLEPNETLLSEEVAISILQETKMSLQRCQLMSKGQDLAKNVLQLFEIELNHLCCDHILYAIELGVQLIPSSDGRNQPDISFFNTVRKCCDISHLMEKQFADTVLPLISSTSLYAECMAKKRDMMRDIENKINVGTEKSIAVIAGWVKSLLQAEQKKTDFRPESEAFVPTNTNVSSMRLLLSKFVY